MRRTLFTILACTALFVAVPALALAHGGHHHKRHHHSRVRHEKFLAHRHDSSTGTGSPTTGTQPTAGTVTSFANNVLTITLANGNTVSGAVTNDTEVKCDNPAADNAGNNGVEQDDMLTDQGPSGGSDGSGGNDGSQGDQGDDNNQGDANVNDQMCTITPGMGVTKAELTINGTGALWNEVELVGSSTTTTTSTSSTS